MELKYNYIFFLPDADFYQPLFNNLNLCGQVKVLYSNDVREIEEKYLESSLKNILCKFFSVRKKHRSFYCYMANEIAFDNDLPNIYVFLDRLAITKNDGLAEVLKQGNLRNRIVLMFGDLVHRAGRNNPLLGNPVDVLDKIDLVTSYDFSDASKHDFHYVKEKYYAPIKAEDEAAYLHCDPSFDLVYLGNAKDRLDFLLKLAEELTLREFKILFLIAGVSVEDRIAQRGVSYIDYIPYVQYLEYMQRSNAILEIVQPYQTAHTIRTSEAVIYGKKLFTNNRFLKDDKDIFAHAQMSLYSNIEDFDYNFLADVTWKAAPADATLWDPLNRLHFFEDFFSHEK